MSASRQSGWAAGKQQRVRLLGCLLLFKLRVWVSVGKGNDFGAVGGLRIT